MISSMYAGSHPAAAYGGVWNTPNTTEVTIPVEAVQQAAARADAVLGSLALANDVQLSLAVVFRVTVKGGWSDQPTYVAHGQAYARLQALGDELAARLLGHVPEPDPADENDEDAGT